MPVQDAVAVFYKVLDELGMDLEPPEEGVQMPEPGTLPEPLTGQADDEKSLEAWVRWARAQAAPLEVVES